MISIPTTFQVNPIDLANSAITSFPVAGSTQIHLALPNETGSTLQFPTFVRLIIPSVTKSG